MIEETLRGLREKNDGLRKKINQQEFSPEEIDQIRNAAKMWRGKIEDISGQKQATMDAPEETAGEPGTGGYDGIPENNDIQE